MRRFRSRRWQGLAGLGPDGVAAYILEGVLEGSLPPGVVAWQTDWDVGRDMQVLVDSRRRQHPSVTRAAGLMAALDQENLAPANPASHPNANPATQPREESDDPTRLAGGRKALSESIDSALAKPDAETLTALESAEQAMAAESHASLIWEAYRIAVNGLSMLDIPGHLIFRRARFGAALREERQAANPAIT